MAQPSQDTIRKDIQRQERARKEETGRRKEQARGTKGENKKEKMETRKKKNMTQTEKDEKERMQEQGRTGNHTIPRTLSHMRLKSM